MTNVNYYDDLSEDERDPNKEAFKDLMKELIEDIKREEKLVDELNEMTEKERTDFIEGEQQEWKVLEEKMTRGQIDNAMINEIRKLYFIPDTEENSI